MTPELALSLIVALLGDIPALVADVEKFIADLKGSPAAPLLTPLQPQVAADMGPLESVLIGAK